MSLWDRRWLVQINGEYFWHQCTYRDDASRYMVSYCATNGDTAVIKDLKGKYPPRNFEFRDGTLYHVTQL